MPYPQMVCKVSFDGADDSTPTWVDVSSKLIAFRIERGGENEFEGLDVGTASLTLDNRTRWADPFNTSSPYSPNVLPRRRLWLQSVDQGNTVDQFYGWLGGWPQSFDADIIQVTTPIARDAFDALSGDFLLDTNPPVSSYEEMVAFDNPLVYIPLTEPAGSTSAHCEIGGRDSDALSGAAPTFGITSLLLATPGDTAAQNTTAQTGLQWVPANGRIGDLAGTSSVSVEAWVRVDTAGTTVTNIIYHEVGSGTATPQYGLRLNSSEQIIFTVRTSGQTDLTSSALTTGTVYHVVGTYDGANMRLYLDGVLAVGPTAKTGALATVATPGYNEAVLDNIVGGTTIYSVGHIAIYTGALGVSRIQAHHDAGRVLAYGQELVNTRIGNVLDGSSVSFLTRSLRTASRQVQEMRYEGRSRREMIDEAVKAEGDPAMVYQNKAGAIVFLDRAHRSASPWNAVVATFDSDGTDVPYQGIVLDDGESFIRNDVRLTPEGGTLQKAEDATSIAAYQRQTLDLGSSFNVSDSDAAAEVDARLAKYKDPLPRVLSLSLSGGQATTRTQMLTRELGDRIRVIYRPKGGGSAIDQELFIRKIVLEGDRRSNPWWSAQWGLAKR
jgi:hypothetical protein